MDFVTLIGSEEVGSAGHRMARAADQMSQAAAHFDSSVTRMEIILDRFIQELRALQEEVAQEARDS